jgi:hypothetical protein
MIHPLNDTSLGCRQARETVPLTNKKSAVTLHPWTMRPWIIRPWKNWMMRPLDYESLGLCVPRTFCPWPFCDNLSPFFGTDHTSPFWKVWTFHPWTVENHCHNFYFIYFILKVLFKGIVSWKFYTLSFYCWIAINMMYMFILVLV